MEYNYKMENQDVFIVESYDTVKENVIGIQKEISLLSDQLTGWKESLAKIIEKYPINTEIRNKLYDDNIIDSRQHQYVRRSCGHYKRMTMGGGWRSCPWCEQKRMER